MVEDDPALMERLFERGYRARPDQAIVFELEAWDVNCPQHITPRYTEAEFGPVVAGLKNRVAELEAQLSARRSATAAA